MKLSSPQIPWNALVFYKDWTPLMEELKMAEQDDIVPPFTLSMSNMMEGGAARLPQDASVRAASSSVTPPLPSTACVIKPSGQKILGGQQPPQHGRRKGAGPADTATNLLATVLAQHTKRQQQGESLAQMEVADRAERRKHELLLLERAAERDLQRELAMQKASADRDLVMQTSHQTFLTSLFRPCKRPCVVTLSSTIPGTRQS